MSQTVSGGFYVGGSFSSVGGHSTNNVAHVNSDGTVDTDFAVTGTSGVVSSAAYDTAADILYIGGVFTSMGGSSRNRLAALDGTTGDTLSWDPDADGVVNSVDIHTDIDGVVTIYAAGVFTDVNSGTTRNRAASFDTSGLSLPGTQTSMLRFGWSSLIRMDRSTSGDRCDCSWRCHHKKQASILEPVRWYPNFV